MGGVAEPRTNPEEALQLFHSLLQRLPHQGPIYCETCRVEALLGNWRMALLLAEHGVQTCLKYGPLWCPGGAMAMRRGRVPCDRDEHAGRVWASRELARLEERPLGLSHCRCLGRRCGGPVFHGLCTLREKARRMHSQQRTYLLAQTPPHCGWSAHLAVGPTLISSRQTLRRRVAELRRRGSSFARAFLCPASGGECWRQRRRSHGNKLRVPHRHATAAGGGAASRCGQAPPHMGPWPTTGSELPATPAPLPLGAPPPPPRLGGAWPATGMGTRARRTAHCCLRTLRRPLRLECTAVDPRVGHSSV